ncbi:MAG: low molecular weight phosphotyrosine protein phosphatase [Spirochaetaceae bacterium]|nr:MAG: low molecular weight phosphotyrosine protein phosphatase [Spirochaetaceae bacterium]
MCMTRIMFVCTGNICRSPMAHGVFVDRIRKRGLEDRFSVESSGTTAYHHGESMDGRAVSELKQHGIRFQNRAKGFHRTDAANYDLILAMDRSNYASLMRTIDTEHQNRIRMFRSFDPEGSGDAEVPDPWYGGREGFTKIYEMISRTVDVLIDRYAESEVEP